MKIVLLDTSTLGEVKNLSKIESYGDLTYYDTTDSHQIVERSIDADIILTNKVVLDKAILEKLPNLKLICITATGTNNVDLDFAKTKGIVVKNAVGYSTNSVSQVTFSMVFHLISNLNNYDTYVKGEEYALSPIFTNIADGFKEINGKKWGVIGMGNIGRNVAKIASAFGAEVVYYSTSGVKREEEYSSVSFDELISESDIISIHSPLNEDTYNLISKEEFSKMKSSAILINVARGGIVNEIDLVNALNENKILGAGVDVFTQEPIEKSSSFFEVKDTNKIVLSPHIAWASNEAREMLIDKVVDNIDEFIESL